MTNSQPLSREKCPVVFELLAAVRDNEDLFGSLPSQIWLRQGYYEEMRRQLIAASISPGDQIRIMGIKITILEESEQDGVFAPNYVIVR